MSFSLTPEIRTWLDERERATGIPRSVLARRILAREMAISRAQSA